MKLNCSCIWILLLNIKYNSAQNIVITGNNNMFLLRFLSEYVWALKLLTV